MLGWDITDYGLGDFERVGFALITLRNGNQKNPQKYPKVYAEKLLMLKEGQHSPMHFHWNKSEDIINRGGGVLLIHLYNDAGDGSFATSDVRVNMDGVDGAIAMLNVKYIVSKTIELILVLLSHGNDLTISFPLLNKLWS